MKGFHNHKDETQLAWLDNRDQVKLDIRKLTRRLENEIMQQVEARFLAALNRDELLEIRPGEEILKTLMVTQARALNR